MFWRLALLLALVALCSLITPSSALARPALRALDSSVWALSQGGEDDYDDDGHAEDESDVSEPARPPARSFRLDREKESNRHREIRKSAAEIPEHDTEPTRQPTYRRLWRCLNNQSSP